LVVSKIIFDTKLPGHKQSNQKWFIITTSRTLAFGN
jgi:hypothetical protein